MVRTMVLVAGSGTPAVYLNTMPRPTTAFRKDHQANAAKPFWVCRKRVNMEMNEHGKILTIVQESFIALIILIQWYLG